MLRSVERGGGAFHHTPGPGQLCTVDIPRSQTDEQQIAITISFESLILVLSYGVQKVPHWKFPDSFIAFQIQIVAHLKITPCIHFVTESVKIYIGPCSLRVLTLFGAFLRYSCLTSIYDWPNCPTRGFSFLKFISINIILGIIFKLDSDTII